MAEKDEAAQTPTDPGVQAPPSAAGQEPSAPQGAAPEAGASTGLEPGQRRPGPLPNSYAASAPPSASALTAEQIDLARVDAALADLDPQFAQSIQQLRKESFVGEVINDGFDELEVEKMERQKATDEAPPDPSKLGWRPRLAALLASPRALLAGIRNFRLTFKKRMAERIERLKTTDWKAGLKTALERAKQIVAALGKSTRKIRTLTGQQKLMILGIVGLFVALGGVLSQLRKERFLPSFETEFVTSVAAYADRSWSFEDSDEMDEFDSPLRHPEYVVAVDKLIVNLRPSESSSDNPMGYFDFYLELNTQEAAVEIQTRMTEINDKMERTIETIRYDDLVTIAGKNKLKVVLRKNINEVLKQGRVRKVFFKSIVIKP